MRKLIVGNFVTIDGYYEAKDKTFDSLFEYYHEDYAGDQNFDYYGRAASDDVSDHRRRRRPAVQRPAAGIA